MVARVKAIKLLVNEMGEDLELDKALRTGILAILDTIEPPEEQPEPEPEPKKKEPKNKKRLDVGRMQALRRGGWSLEKIAGEMGCSAQTVANHLKKAGVE